MNGRRERLVLLMALAGTSSACRDAAGPEPDFSSHYAVYAALEVASPDVSLLAESLTELGTRLPLRGAEATVSGASGSVLLTEAPRWTSSCFLESDAGPVPADDGCYTGTLPQPPGTAEALSLDIVLPDGSRIRGSAVTPGPPVASIPPDSQRVEVFVEPRDPLDRAPRAIVPIFLHSAPGATRVDVVATVAGVEPGACTIDAWTAPYFAPRLEGKHDWYIYELPRCRPGTVYGFGDDSLDISIHVIAMEENYAGYMNHVLGSSSIDASRAGFGLEGAVGSSVQLPQRSYRSGSSTWISVAGPRACTSRRARSSQAVLPSVAMAPRVLHRAHPRDVRFSSASRAPRSDASTSAPTASKASSA